MEGMETVVEEYCMKENTKEGGIGGYLGGVHMYEVIKE